MFENIKQFFKKFDKRESETVNNSREAAKERLHLVLMQDRANVSADFLELMKQEIIDVIKKYIEVDEKSIDVRLTNKENSDGTNGAPALYANIPILNIKNEARKVDAKPKSQEEQQVKEKINDNDKIQQKQANKESDNSKKYSENHKDIEEKENKKSQEKDEKAKTGAVSKKSSETTNNKKVKEVVKEKTKEKVKSEN